MQNNTQKHSQSEKIVFSEEDIIQEQTSQPFQAKQVFDEEDVVIENDPNAYQTLEENREVEGELLFEEDLKPSRFRVRVIMTALVLFCIALLAQGVQWIYDAITGQQWITLFFAIAFFLISLTGVGTIFQEWRKLRKLRQHELMQQEAEQYRKEPNSQELPTASGEKTQDFCKALVAQMNATPQLAQSEKQWLAQINDYHNAEQVMSLFSQTVLSPMDKQARQLIAKHARDNAVIVALSPIAVVDVLMVAWRNFALINKITKIYGMELGYFSRLHLFKMVIKNMVFAGTTELVAGMLSHNVLRKLFGQAIQGLGVGILTARLGIKAMEFCRPINFTETEKPSLKAMSKDIYLSIANSEDKEMFFKKSSEEEKLKR